MKRKNINNIRLWTTNFISKRVEVCTYKQAHDTRFTTKRPRFFLNQSFVAVLPDYVARSRQVLPLIYLPSLLMNSTDTY